MLIDFAIPFIKIFFMNICIFYVAIKIINYKVNSFEKIAIAVLSLVIAIGYSVIRKWTTISILYPIYYYIFIFIFSKILNLNFLRSTVLALNVITISIISFFLSATINFFMMYMMSINTTDKNIIEFTIIGIIQLILL